ncbi:hypothetical protein SELMODRAFT_232041 [Selaginella moellendorffii]|uniref:Xyloglucan endotransglucosylase/hydrolase n=1 Tax=Selaginella moellendorffii TaxID=88036 RepID=D8RQT7_SELML|nr:hypothetical protein SELMODRAFT_232041 [Selaginella moellendorffii]
MFDTTSFSQHFSVVWGFDHSEVSENGMEVTLKLDSTSGSGIRSHNNYTFGFFNSAVKLPANYSSGVVSTFYVSNEDSFPFTHDEIDLEFLGAASGDLYIIQTNIYSNGSTSTGREQRFKLWFDPTAGFHNYSIFWTPYHIVFFVDDIPIREVLKSEELGEDYPLKPMNVFATIWDASQWATDGGRSTVDYSYAPFATEYSNLILSDCHSSTLAEECPSGASSVVPQALLSESQHHLLHWIRANYMIYDYCEDKSRYPQALPECRSG